MDHESKNYDIPSYTADIFAGRQKIIDEILQKIKPDQKRKSAPVFVITGERGSGKSFLMMHLHRTIFPQEKISSCLLHLAPLSRGETLEGAKNEWLFETAHEKIQETLLAILRKIGIWLEIDSTQVESGVPAELSTWITRKLQERPNRQFAFLFDSTFEANWTLLEQLEKYLLAPVASLSNAVLVISGRGQAYPWTSAFLRTENISLLLEPFPLEDTRDSLQKLKEYRNIFINPKLNVDQIHDETLGHPLMVVLRAQGAPWEVIVQELMIVVPEDKREDYIQYLLALAPLDGFRDEVMVEILNAYFQKKDSREQWDSKMVREKVREPLAAQRLIFWKTGRFVIDPNLRWALYNLLLEPQYKETWYRMNKEAERLYRDWSSKYPRSEEFFNKEADRYQFQAEKSQLCN